MTLTPQLASALTRAQATLQAGRAGEAWTALVPLRRQIDNHGGALRLYALVAQQVGKVDEAVAALRRIMVIERDPPEIVGALADTLGKAGRFGEALPLWDRLVALQPGAADAHLNRAVTAASAGRHDAAIAAADAGLARFPNHARMLATRAMALKNLGRLDEALDGFARAIAADPARALTHHNHGVTLRAACRFDEACQAFAAAARLGIDNAQSRSNWAAAALEAGRVEEAADHYRRAIALDPAHAEARRGLTRLEIEYRGGSDAFDHYEEAVRARPDEPGPWVDWLAALMANKRNAEALDVATEALGRHPGLPTLKAVRAFCEGIVGDADAGLSDLQQLVAEDPANIEARAALAQVAIRARRPGAALPILEEDVRREPLNQLHWAFLGLAWRMVGDPREEWLCDYERLVMPVEVDDVDEGLDPVAFAALVAAALDPLHATNAAPGDQSLKHGTQSSGVLFDRPDPVIQRFRRSVVAAARRALRGHRPDPDHPFLSRLSDDFAFSGSWSVRLQPGGHHVAHVHPEGWMSSAYYARLPQAVARSADRQGWIEFGRPPAFLDLDLEARRVVQPAVGRLVLFPSYLWHGTVPFEADGQDRLTAAFDYQPL